MIHLPLGRVVVACEGAGDDSFFRHLVESRALGSITTAYSELSQPGGRQGFSELLRALRTQRGFGDVARVLVVSDNDNDPAQSFAEVLAQVRSAQGYGIPSKPLEWAHQVGTPEVGAFMMPDVGQPGDLETLCLVAARDKWPAVTACAEAYAECAGVTGWATNKRSKMLLRSVIAATCETDPNTSLVHIWSRTQKYEIPLQHSCFDKLADFLRTAAQ